MVENTGIELSDRSVSLYDCLVVRIFFVSEVLLSPNVKDCREVWGLMFMKRLANHVGEYENRIGW